MAVVGVDAELVDDFKRVFAPVLDIDQGVVQRRAIFAVEALRSRAGLGGSEDIGSDDFVQQAGEFGFGQVYAVERLELLAEISFKRGLVADVGAVVYLRSVSF